MSLKNQLEKVEEELVLELPIHALDGLNTITSQSSLGSIADLSSAAMARSDYLVCTKHFYGAQKVKVRVIEDKPLEDR